MFSYKRLLLIKFLFKLAITGELNRNFLLSAETNKLD